MNTTVSDEKLLKLPSQLVLELAGSGNSPLIEFQRLYLPSSDLHFSVDDVYTHETILKIVI